MRLYIFLVSFFNNASAQNSISSFEKFNKEIVPYIKVNELKEKQI
jgi:hypothetical protein